MNRISLYIALSLVGLIPLRSNPVITLNEWESSANELIQNDELVLPAGTQLYRTLTGGGITLRINSTPVFSSEPEDVAVLEFGSNALALTHSAGTGQITLLSGDLEPQILSPSIALDETGRVTEPLALELTQRGHTLFLTLQGQTQQIESEPLTGTTLIVLSSGASHDWTIHELSVTSEPLSVSGSSDPDGSNSDQSSDEGKSPSSSSAASSSDSLESTRDISAAIEDSSNRDVKKARRAVRLEVFTPPAVRRGRSAAVRAALAQSQLN